MKGVLLAVVVCISMTAWLCSGCKKEEAAENGINGIVMLDGAAASDVIVELFEEPNLDSTTVWYQTARNPSVGFRYSPQAAFDWRRDFRGLLQGVASGTDGHFQFDGLEDNDYILVARKRYIVDGDPYWAWTLPRTVSLRGSAADVGSLVLFEPTVVPNLPLSGAVTWEGAGHTYRIEGTLNIPAGSSLTIEPGAVIQLPYRGRILVEGQLTAIGTPSEFISFTSELEEPTTQDWDNIFIFDNALQTEFEYCRFDYVALAAVRGYNNQASFDHCYFSNLAGEGINHLGSENGELVTITRCVFNGVSVGATISGVASLTIAHNIFFSDRSYGLRAQTISGGEIFCNWFQDCGRFDTAAGERSGVMYLGDMENFEVHHNHIIESAFAHDIGSRVDSTVRIHHNSYQSINRVLNIGVTEEELGPSYPRFNFNSMISIDKINVIVHSCHINNHTVDCTSNFWNQSSPAEVLRRMVDDCSDFEEGQRSFVIVEPVLENAPSDAGICESN